MTGDELHKAFEEWYRTDKRVPALLDQLHTFPSDRRAINQQIAELAFANGPGDVVEKVPPSEQRNLILSLIESATTLQRGWATMSVQLENLARSARLNEGAIAAHELWLKELAEGDKQEQP